MADVKNILVGAAQLFVSRGTGINRPVTKPGTQSSGTAKGDINWTSTQSAKSYLQGSSASPYWRDVGYTNNGLEISYEPGYNDVMVDQLLDAARLFKSTLKVLLTTELTESTLENVNLAFGQTETQLTWSVTGTASTTTVLNYDGSTATTPSATLAIAAGALGDAPVERTIVAVGNAPYHFGTTGSSYGTASTTALGSDVSSPNKERVYVARRVVQIQSTAHGLKRDSATVFPVQFRCLPDDNDLYDGAEYGVIIDRVFTTA